MSDDQKETLNRWIDLAYKIGTPVGLAALFFLKSKFATREELDVLAERVSETNSTIRVMLEQSKVSERHQRVIDDHEARLRLMELRR